MTHPRTAIRLKVWEALKASAALAALCGDSIYKDRFTPIPFAKLPAVVISILAEDIDPESFESAPRRVYRTATVSVDCFSRKSESTDDVATLIDDMCAHVEEAIAADDSLGGDATDCRLLNTEIEFQDEGEKIIGMARMNWAVEYDSYLPATTDDLDDLDTIQTNYSLNGDQAAADQAQDVTDVSGA